MTTEIESRYIVPDRTLFNKLLRLDRLGHCDLQPRGTQKIVDYYLDTRGRAILRQGWACRLRSQDGDWILTLKGPKVLRGAVMSRPEFEVTLSERIEDIARWPRGALRSRVLELTGGLPLQHLLSIKQTRHRFLLRDGERQVAELSLDVVRISRERVHHRSYMLECELLDEGQMSDLERLDGLLSDDYFLVPEPRSKLQRALQLIERGGLPDETGTPGSSPMTIAVFSRRYDIDLAQAKRVADLADQLYERLLPLHRLSESRRSLLRTSALLHNVGRAADQARRHIIGRDIILRQPIEGVGRDEQRIVAAAAYLHRKKVTLERIAEILPDTLPSEFRQEALIIAALVRLASALDAVGVQSAQIGEIEGGDEDIRITLAAPLGAKKARQIRSRSDLLSMFLGAPLEWSMPITPDGGAVDAGASQKGIGLRPTDTMRAAAGKVLRFHFERMLQHQPGTRLGKDSEELHDMRVATRRMRSALQFFAPYVHGALVTTCNDGLRKLARVLGDVRDMDVAIENAYAYLADLPSSETCDLDPLLRAWRVNRRGPRRYMLRYFHSRGYQNLLHDMEALLDSLQSGQAATSKHDTLNRVAPRFLHVRWQIVHAYDAVLENAPVELLHALRIDCKRLRYGLEFFREVLPNKVVAIIPEVVALQDHLGELHDAAVAIAMLDGFLAEPQEGYDLEGVRAYRKACQARMARRLRTFPDAWRRFSRAKVRGGFERLRTLSGE